MRYYAPIVIKDGQAQYDCIVEVTPEGSIDVSPFICETPSTIALSGIVVITDRDDSVYPARETTESLDSYASRLIEIETRHMMTHDPADDEMRAIHASYYVTTLRAR